MYYTVLILRIEVVFATSTTTSTKSCRTTSAIPTTINIAAQFTAYHSIISVYHYQLVVQVPVHKEVSTSIHEPVPLHTEVEFARIMYHLGKLLVVPNQPSWHKH